MIADRQQEQEQQPAEPEESLKDKVPGMYHDCLDFFSKQQSDTLAPYCSIDHRIKLLDSNKDLGFSSLQKQSLEELTAMRDYLTSSLAKGFIVPSTAPFAAPVLFACKPNGALCFCVDY